MLFYKTYNVYRIVYMFVSSGLQVSLASPSFIAQHFPVSEIAMYCLRCLLLFYKNYIIYQIVYKVSITSPSFISVHLRVYEIAKYIT